MHTTIIEVLINGEFLAHRFDIDTGGNDDELEVLANDAAMECQPLYDEPDHKISIQPTNIWPGDHGVPLACVEVTLKDGEYVKPLEVPEHIDAQAARVIEEIREAIAEAMQTKSKEKTKITLSGNLCTIAFAYYCDGSTAMLLNCDRGQYAKASVYVEGAELAEDEIVLKNYSENETISRELLAAGIVEETGRTVKSGFVEMPICKILIPIVR